MLLAVLFLLAAAALFFWTVTYFTGSAESVVISVPGEKTGEYDLAFDHEISVCGGSNIVQIKDGRVFMKSASCKNQYCVNHAPIEKGNEQIVCLPNQVLVQITEGRESEIDIVAN